MGLDNLIDTIKHEVNVWFGSDSKDRLYASEHVYPDEEAAQLAFQRAVVKLFAVNKWTELPGITASFELHQADGQPKSVDRAEVGDFVKIVLPGLNLENWVTVIAVDSDENKASFTVRPSHNPQENHPEAPEETKHFFSSESTSTFQVTRRKNRLQAYEIGLNESPNNQGDEAGDRPIVNTLVAAGGWAFFQKVQWKKLTEYLVNSNEV